MKTRSRVSFLGYRSLVEHKYNNEMKRLHFLLTTAFVVMSFGLTAQETEAGSEEKLSYYEKRAREDAQFEQSQKLENEKEEEEFWEDQKEYEKKLKKRDRKAYKAYMKGKRDAYAEHEQHCDSHCHHSSRYHYHASFYYHGHDHYEYRRSPRRTSVRTNVGIGLPSIRVGL